MSTTTPLLLSVGTAIGMVAMSIALQGLILIVLYLFWHHHKTTISD